MKIREHLKKLYREKHNIHGQIASKTSAYINALEPDEHGIYITDHAIVRYLERVCGVVFPCDLSDEDKLKWYKVPPETVRKEMLTLEDDRTILNKQKGFYIKYDYAYIIKELTLVTVIKFDLRID